MIREATAAVLEDELRITVDKAGGDMLASIGHWHLAAAPGVRTILLVSDREHGSRLRPLGKLGSQNMLLAFYLGRHDPLEGMLKAGEPVALETQGLVQLGNGRFVLALTVAD